MSVPSWQWAVTLVALGVLLVVDLAVVGRRPHEPSVRESATWVGFYTALAIMFGAAVWWLDGAEYAGQFFAGWLTEYSLSVDNLFVFVIIMGRFAVPREYQQRALMVGIVLALVLRGCFIAAGSAVIREFSWVFFLFGAFLVYTAVGLVRHREADPDDFRENLLLRWTQRVLPLASGYDGARLTTRKPGLTARRPRRAPRRPGRAMLTPMVVVLIAIGSTDLIFALDSIPAVFGLTKEPYLVLVVNVFALMGLRQLYFLLGNLLDRLVFLSFGLAAVLGFIGVKLVVEALHDNSLWFINDGQPVAWAPDVPILMSLTVVLGTLAVTVVASLWSHRRNGGPPRAPRDPEGPSAVDGGLGGGAAGLEDGECVPQGEAGADGHAASNMHWVGHRK